MTLWLLSCGTSDVMFLHVATFKTITDPFTKSFSFDYFLDWSFSSLSLVALAVVCIT